MLQHYVFGYGSLICPTSRAITLPHTATKCVIPVVVRGLERTWTMRCNPNESMTGRGWTAMGILPKSDASTVGVLVPVDECDFVQLDQREIGYDRILIDLNRIDKVPFLDHDKHYDNKASDTFFSHTEESDNRVCVWAYLQQNPLPPSPETPIVQSYVDVIMRGCLSISIEFAQEFVKSTKGWSTEELDDLLMIESTTVKTETTTTTTTMTMTADNSNVSSSIHSGCSSTSSTVSWIDDRDDPVYTRCDQEWSLKQGPNVVDPILQEHRPYHLSERVAVIQ